MTTPNDQPAGPGQTSLLDQFQKTRESFMGLLSAHIELAKAEINDILGEVKVLATLSGIALGIALMTASCCGSVAFCSWASGCSARSAGVSRTACSLVSA